MSAPQSRSTYGDETVDKLLSELVAAVGTDANDDLVRNMIVTALDMDRSDVDRLELKIGKQALVEMLNAWRVFSPYRDRPKATIFGSARTKPDQPDYQLTVDVGKHLSERGWMALTGAGPGIMTAGIEGAGRENSMGVNIVLPFEQRASPVIDGDPKLATFRYFFTRKLTFMKESDAFILAPGGFGTLDEAFELMTLVQTGKSRPVPIVLLDHEGSTYWDRWKEFVEGELLQGGMISEADPALYFHTHNAAEAVEHLSSFYAWYHSVRFVERKLVIRLRKRLPDGVLEALNSEFGDILTSGQIEPIEATKEEVADGDHLDLPRLGLNFNNRSFARMVGLIHRLNALATEPGTEPAKEIVIGKARDLFNDGSPELTA